MKFHCLTHQPPDIESGIWSRRHCGEWVGQAPALQVWLLSPRLLSLTSIICQTGGWRFYRLHWAIQENGHRSPPDSGFAGRWWLSSSSLNSRRGSTSLYRHGSYKVGLGPRIPLCPPQLQARAYLRAWHMRDARWQCEGLWLDEGERT